jgi:hypothetical protein
MVAWTEISHLAQVARFRWIGAFLAIPGPGPAPAAPRGPQPDPAAPDPGPSPG